MTAVGWLPAPAEDLFGPEATAEESYEVLTVDVPPASWIAALTTARDDLGCTYFDWLSAVDEPGTGFRVAAHVAALSPVRRLLIRTTVPHEAPILPTAIDVYAGAAWHERETHEMFGVTFEGHPSLDHLLLPDSFEGHPLRKDFVLAARVAKAWPGAKEPGESEHGGPKRRQMLPPGVPDPNEWGPLKGQLPPAPARPTRGAGRAGAGERPVRAAGERPVRRTRSAAEGSASQPGATTGAATGAATPRAGATATDGSTAKTSAAKGPATEASAEEQAVVSPEEQTGVSGARPRRARTAAQGSASQITSAEAEAPASTSTDKGATPEADGPHPTTPGTPTGQRRARTATEGSASQRAGEGTQPAGPRRSRSASGGSASQRAASDAEAPADGGDEAVTPPESAPDPKAPMAPRSPDAPWHHARPAFDEPETERRSDAEPSTGAPIQRPEKPTETDRAPEAEPLPDTRQKPEAAAQENPTGEDPSPDDPTGGPQ